MLTDRHLRTLRISTDNTVLYLNVLLLRVIYCTIGFAVLAQFF